MIKKFGYTFNSERLDVELTDDDRFINVEVNKKIEYFTSKAHGVWWVDSSNKEIVIEEADKKNYRLSIL